MEIKWNLFQILFVFNHSIVIIAKTGIGYCPNGNSTVCCTNYRLNNGICEACPIGTFGDNCTEMCPNGTYGRSCLKICNCSTTENCDAVKGCTVNPEIITRESALTTNANQEIKTLLESLSDYWIGITFGSLGCCITCSAVTFFLCCKKCSRQREKSCVDKSETGHNNLKASTSQNNSMQPCHSRTIGIANACTSLESEKHGDNVYAEINERKSKQVRDVESTTCKPKQFREEPNAFTSKPCKVNEISKHNFSTPSTQMQSHEYGAISFESGPYDKLTLKAIPSTVRTGNVYTTSGSMKLRTNREMNCQGKSATLPLRQNSKTEHDEYKDKPRTSFLYPDPPPDDYFILEKSESNDLRKNTLCNNNDSMEKDTNDVQLPLLCRSKEEQKLALQKLDKITRAANKRHIQEMSKNILQFKPQTNGVNGMKYGSKTLDRSTVKMSKPGEKMLRYSFAEPANI